MQRTWPRCQASVRAVRGVRGADTRQINMSDTAMLQMYMLDGVLSSELLLLSARLGRSIISQSLDPDSSATLASLASLPSTFRTDIANK